jgi:hypothetical protein
MDPSCYNPAIKEYLEEERRLVDVIGYDVDVLAEVGCMRGAYLDWAIKHQKSYIGIDFMAEYIAYGQARIAEYGLSPDIYQFVHGNAEDLCYLFDFGSLPPQRHLLLFPFNSIGNIVDLEQVLANLYQIQMPFLFSSYQTTEYATNVRSEYYINCGYQQVGTVRSPEGICVTSSDGLRSFAYYPEYLEKVCRNHGLFITAAPFSAIGMAYMANVISPIELLDQSVTLP